MGDSQGITRKQEKTIVALVTTNTVTEAAKKAGVGETTIYKWLTEPAFQAHFRDARRKIVEKAMGQVQMATEEAVKALREIVMDKDAPSSSRVTAARTIMEFATKAIELEELAERVETLENLIKEGERYAKV